MKYYNVFIFSHQDDEFGVFGELERLQSNKEKIIVIYLTSGTLDGNMSPVRNNESRDVLLDIGLNKNDIYFLGGKINIPDAKLYMHLDIIYKNVVSLLDSTDKIKTLYFSAWEGGHQDHDAAHILGLALAKKFDIKGSSFQFPLYNGYKSPWIFFRVFNPLVGINGKPITFIISWSNRLRFIRYILNYRSQFFTFVGLFPFFILHNIFKGTQILQPINADRVLERPHEGKLLYERRGVLSFEKFMLKTKKFIQENC